MNNETETTRALHPVLGVGREPVLVEKATGAAMIVMDWDLPALLLIEEFWDHIHPQMFLTACKMFTPRSVVENWESVVEDMTRLGFCVVESDDNG